MGDARCESRLVEKHFDEIRIARVLGMEALYGDGTREPGGAL
jgi:hypothetical protein